MTTAKEASLELTLTDGVTETTTEDNAGGIITVSRNTRLTKLKGTLSRCPELVPISSNASNCGGLIPGGRDNLCAYFENGAHQRIAGTSTTPVIGLASGTPGQNAYYPYPLIDSGFVVSGSVAVATATCFDALGQQWFVSPRWTGTNDVSVIVSVSLGGADVATTRAIAHQTNGIMWVGVTPCAGGVIVWYAAAAGITLVRCSISGDTLVVGTPSSLFQPLSELTFRHADVVSDGNNTAWLLTRDVADNFACVLSKVNLTTLTVFASLSLPSVLAASTRGFAYMALSLVSDAGHDYLAVSISSGITYRAVHAQGDLHAIWAIPGGERVGPTAVQPWFSGSNRYLVFANSIIGTAVGTSATGVIFDTFDIATGVFIDEAYAYWYSVQGPGVSHQPAGSTDRIPFFPLFAKFGEVDSVIGTVPPSPPESLTSGTPTLYMDTPSIEVVTMFSPTIITPVMRFGIDKVSAYSGGFPCSSAPAAVSADGRACFCYLEDRIDQPTSEAVADSTVGGFTIPATAKLFSSRYVVFDLRPATQPGYASDTGNVTTIAAGMPAVWDGCETTEYSPFHRPLIQVLPDGGSGDTITGKISFSAVVSWRDGAGQVRRSAPAFPFTIELTAAMPTVYVTMPLTMRSGQAQEWYDVHLYSTVPDGDVFIALEARIITRGQQGCWYFARVPYAVLGDPELYSQFIGIQPLHPECPPPIWDDRSIAGRIWVIDAEDRYRLLPSKLKEPGIAYEFNSNLEIRGFDQQYGKLMAIADVGGLPVAFAERGIWQVDGYGPDNSGQGDTFDSPRLISNMGCRARHTVCQVPGVGVVFQANDGHFCLLAGGFKRFETFGVYDVQAPTIHLLQNEVIYPLTDGTGHVVYNWLADGWTHWVNPVAQVPTMTATLQGAARSRTYQAVLSAGACVIGRLDSDNASSSATHPIQAVRGWVAPESTQGDCVNRDVWLQSLYAGPHGIRVRVAFDYNETKFVEREWSAAELAGLVKNGRYTVGVDCHASQARAFKVTVTELDAGSSGDGFQPMSLTVIYGVSPGFRAISQFDKAKK